MSRSGCGMSIDVQRLPRRYAHRGGLGFRPRRCKILMDQRHGGSAFTYCAANPLHGTGAHVADCKHAGNARLQRSGHMPCSVAYGRLTCQHKAMRVESDATAFEPTSLGVSAYEKEHVPDW